MGTQSSGSFCKAEPELVPHKCMPHGLPMYHWCTQHKLPNQSLLRKWEEPKAAGMCRGQDLQECRCGFLALTPLTPNTPCCMCCRPTQWTCSVPGGQGSAAGGIGHRHRRRLQVRVLPTEPVPSTAAITRAQIIRGTPNVFLRFMPLCISVHAVPVLDYHSQSRKLPNFFTPRTLMGMSLYCLPAHHLQR